MEGRLFSVNVVVVKAPKFLRGILRRIFRVGNA